MEVITMSLQNPFVYGKLVKGNEFANRENEKRNLKIALKGGQNVILYSPRRYGKSSLAEVISEELQKEGVRVVKVNIEEEQEMSMAFGVRSVPTLVYMVDGSVVDRAVGVKSVEQLKELTKVE